MVRQDVAGIGLQEAIESIRADLLGARDSGEDGDVRFPVSSVTVELQVVAERESGGKAGFKVPLVNVEVGGESMRRSQNTSRVTVVLGPPVDRSGAPIKVAKDSLVKKG